MGRVSPVARHEEAGQQWFEFRLFLAYCLIFYAAPFTLFLFLGNPLENVFRPRPIYALGMLYVVASALFFRLMQKIPRQRFRRAPYRLSALFFAPYTGLATALLFLAISIWSFINLGYKFRQTGDALSELGAIGFVLAFSKVVMGTAIIVHYRLVKEGVDPAIRSFCLLLIALGFAINVQASFDILIALTAYVAATHLIRRSLRLHGKNLQTISFVMAPMIVLLLFFVGKANKIGIDETLHIIGNMDLFLYSFLERYSYHMYSVSTHVNENFFNFRQALDALREVASVVYFRFGSIVGLAVERPELGSVARMNFFVLADFYKDRIGTSPGMLGSVFFFPGAGFAICYVVLLLRFIFSLFWKIMGDTMSNWLFIFLSVLLASTTVDSLLDAFNPLSNGFVRVFSLYLGASYVVAILARRASSPQSVLRRTP